jgi:hypothetical protein
VGLGCWPDDRLATVPLPEPQDDGRTLFFPDRSLAVALEPRRKAFPPDYQLVTRDAALFARSFDAADTVATFGSVEAVLRHRES